MSQQTEESGVGCNIRGSLAGPLPSNIFRTSQTAPPARDQAFRMRLGRGFAESSHSTELVSPLIFSQWGPTIILQRTRNYPHFPNSDEIMTIRVNTNSRYCLCYSSLWQYSVKGNHLLSHCRFMLDIFNGDNCIFSPLHYTEVCQLPSQCSDTVPILELAGRV